MVLSFSFDIEDRKGLEIVILTALLTFQDSNEQYHIREDSTSARRVSDKGPTLPPKPAPRTGVERIVEMQAMRGEYNVIIVEEEGNVNDYAQHCSDLLQVCIETQSCGICPYLLPLG